MRQGGPTRVSDDSAVGRSVIRDATEADFPRILRLNSEWVHFTSALDEPGLRLLDAAASYHRIAESDGRVVAVLLALREGADYDSLNYRWFDERGGEFLYVDRILVDAADQGRGFARLLYEDMLAFARQNQVGRVVCELDVEPPNEASRRFHDSFGFVEVGTQWVAEGAKRVSLRELQL